MYLEYQYLAYYQITDAPGRAARVERPHAHAGRAPRPDSRGLRRGLRGDGARRGSSIPRKIARPTSDLLAFSGN